MKKALKRSLSLLLAITIIFGSMYVGLGEVDFSGINLRGLFAVEAHAASSGTCGDNLTWTLDDEGTLTISGSGTMTNYSSSSSVPWYSSRSSVKSAIIENGVTSIGEWAFCYCTSLISITIPDGVTSIGDYAFNGCSSLTSITISGSVISIGDAAFRYCTNLISIAIPDDITNIGDKAFYDTGYYNDSSNWENQVLYIGNHLIEAKEVLTGSYIINVGTKSIACKAFNGCSSLTSITIPDSVTSIGSYAFMCCSNILSITIPNSVTSIGGYAFYDCESLASIIIPDGVTSIGDYTFSSCNSLTSITIPDSVTSIGEGAFNGCSSLKSITIPNGVTTIGDYAFSSCASLTSIKIPDSVTSIGNSAFDSCTSLTSVTIPEGVISIGDSTFNGCTNLVSISISGSVTSIGDCAFCNCTNLTAVYITDLAKWCTIKFYHSYSNPLYSAKNLYINGELAKDIVIPDSVTTINNYAFAGCTSLTSIMIPDSVTSIGGAFSECENIESIEIGNCVTSIGYSAFDSCTGLTSITIPDSVIRIEDSAFQYCESLTDVYYGGTEADWANIVIDSYNSDLTNATIHYHEHTFINEWVIDIEPTCTETGLKHNVCSKCGVVFQNIPATGHLDSFWITEQQPTCTVDGNKDEWCLDCGEIINTEIIPANGHNYKLVSVLEEHPHTNTFECSRCSDIKTEDVHSENCNICNFSYTNVDDATCNITGYIGNSNSFVIPSTIMGRVVTTTTTGAFKNNTTLSSVKIEEGVQGLGALAFLGCSSLSKVVVPESVTSIGDNAFYNCASDFTIYCYRDTYAMQYAIDNSLNYVVMDIGETEDSIIDYENKLIFLSKDCVTSLDDILYVPSSSMAFAEASHISGDNEFLGTGSIVTVFDGNDISSEYTVIVEGDTNGDSVCDVLDTLEVAKVSNGHTSFDGAYAIAADSNADDIIDINDYQDIVNKAVS